MAIVTQKMLKEEMGEAGEEEREGTGHQAAMEEKVSPDMVKVFGEGIGRLASVEE